MSPEFRYVCDRCGYEIQAKSPQELADLGTQHDEACPGSKEERIPEIGTEGWQERTAQYFTFDEPGEVVEGRILAFDHIQLHDREVRRCRLETAEGNRSFLLTTQLEPLLLDLPVGTMVRILYEGEVKSARGRRVKVFKVWTKG